MQRVSIVRSVLTALVVLAATMPIAWAQQQQRPLLIVRNSSPNQNGAILVNAYAVPSNQPGNWGPDLLGQIIVSPQSMIGIFLTPGICVYDVRLVFDNGFSAERRAVDTCGGSQNVVDVNGGIFTQGGQGGTNRR